MRMSMRQFTRPHERFSKKLENHAASGSYTTLEMLTKIERFRFPFTSVAIVFDTIVLLEALIADVNIIEVPLGLLDRIEQHEIGTKGMNESAY